MVRLYSKYLTIFLLHCLCVVYASATVHSVNDVEGLILQLGALNNGDTLLIGSGEYLITSEVAPNGLKITNDVLAPYSDVVIMGEGIGETIIDFNHSYGFLAYRTDNVLITDMSIINAGFNGAIYVDRGELNLARVHISNCESLTSDTKPLASGGGIYYGDGSMFSYITDCVFSNNWAESAGGAIALSNTSSSAKVATMNIERCQFDNNSSAKDGSAISINTRVNPILLSNNLIFENTGGSSALYFDGNKKVILKNNTIALNYRGVTVDQGIRSLFYIDNNVVVDNYDFDIKGIHSSTSLIGDYNVCRTIIDATYTGYFNDEVNTYDSFFHTEEGSLIPNFICAEYLVGRVPAIVSVTTDWEGVERLFPADIGAQILPFSDRVAVWTGSSDQNFAYERNWMNELKPSDADLVIVSACTLDSYPIIDSEFDGADLRSVKLFITPNGILENRGLLELDTLLVESMEGGTGQFYNVGFLVVNDKQIEYYVKEKGWSPIHFTQTSLLASEIFPLMAYDSDFYMSKYDESDQAMISLASNDVLDQSQGYMLYSDVQATTVSESFSSPEVSFDVEHTNSGSSLFEGLNLLGNPFEIALNSDVILADYSDFMAGAVYVYKDGRFQARVDGIGSASASSVGVHQSFYVQHKDVDPFEDKEKNTIILTAEDAVVAEPALQKSASVNGGLIEIAIVGENGSVIDETYIRFRPGSDVGFEYDYDALKLPRLAGDAKMLISSSVEGVDYNVNSLELQDDVNVEIDIPINYGVSDFEENNLELRFDISQTDVLGCLWHDADRDSSQSLILSSGDILDVSTGTDSSLLMERYSLQIFDGSVPNYVVGLDTRESAGQETFFVNGVDTVTVYDTIPFQQHVREYYVEDTLFTNTTYIDTVYITDSLFSFSYNNVVDYDTMFTDTFKVLGTYEYTVTYVDATSDTTVTDFIRIFDKEYHFSNKLITVVSDTTVTSSIDDGKLSSDFYVYTGLNKIIIESNNDSPADVVLYDMSGRIIKIEYLPLGSGIVSSVSSGVCLVNITSNGLSTIHKVIVKN